MTEPRPYSTYDTHVSWERCLIQREAVTFMDTQTLPMGTLYFRFQAGGTLSRNLKLVPFALIPATGLSSHSSHDPHLMAGLPPRAYPGLEHQSEAAFITSISEYASPDAVPLPATARRFISSFSLYLPFF